VPSKGAALAAGWEYSSAAKYWANTVQTQILNNGTVDYVVTLVDTIQLDGDVSSSMQNFTFSNYVACAPAAGAPAVPPSPPPPLVTFDYVDFDTAASGRKSTATVTPYFGGVTPTGPITWTIASVQNPTAAWWKRSASDPRGLTWGSTPDSSSYWTSATVEGTAPTGMTAQLTDIIGNRTVRVRAVTTIDGATVAIEIDVTFGNGPLSAFAGGPTATTSQFATAVDANAVLAANPTDPGVFNVVVGVCGGTVPVDKITVTGPPSPTLTITEDPLFWTPNAPGSWAFFSTDMKLPTYDQLLGVSRHNGILMPGFRRHGAALAAGWDYSSSAKYWVNTLDFNVIETTPTIYDLVLRLLVIQLDGEGTSYDVIDFNNQAYTICLP
jgi:hypothetical protein